MPVSKLYSFPSENDLHREKERGGGGERKRTEFTFHFNFTPHGSDGDDNLNV